MINILLFSQESNSAANASMQWQSEMYSDNDSEAEICMDREAGDDSHLLESDEDGRLSVSK